HPFVHLRLPQSYCFHDRNKRQCGELQTRVVHNHALTLSWTIDAWGNRTTQSASQGTCTFSQTIGTTNRFSAGSYDGAGNLLSDGPHVYTFDAENRISSVDSGATAIYVYDADGNRVAKSVGGAVTCYVYGSDGQVVSERISQADGSTVWNQTYIHF